MMWNVRFFDLIAIVNNHLGGGVHGALRLDVNSTYNS